VERAFSDDRREPDDLSATDARNKCTVMIHKCTFLDSVPIRAQKKPTLGTIASEKYSEGGVGRERPSESRRGRATFGENRPLENSDPATEWNSGQYQKIYGWLSVPAIAERLHRAAPWRLAGGKAYRPSSFGIGAVQARAPMCRLMPENDGRFCPACTASRAEDIKPRRGADGGTTRACRGPVAR
jgi:hypothetical protein